MDTAYTGNRIAALRKDKGWTQKELADRLHVTDKAVSKWERGLNFPELSLLEPLAATLGTTVADLLGLENPSGDQMLAAALELHQKENAQLRGELRNLFGGLIIAGIFLIIGMSIFFFFAPDTFKYDGLLGEVLAANATLKVLHNVLFGLGGSLIGSGIGMMVRYTKK